MSRSASGKSAVLLLALIAIATGVDACGSNESGNGAAGMGGMTGGAAGADGAPDSNGGDGAASDARPDVPLGPCASCGAGRSNASCSSAVADCQANKECSKIFDCVYDGQPGCPLGETGAACVAECVRAYCFTSESAKLFYAAELCAYCDGGCKADCADYCGGFVVDAGTAECVTLDGSLEPPADGGLGGAAGAGTGGAADGAVD